MKNNIRFSIIIPNYNKGIYISECLDSVVNQTLKNIEIIFIDDGSTDNSLEIVKQYNNIKILETNRLQAGGARNLGIKHATGEYIIFLDSDDYLTDNTVLEKLSNLIKDEDVVFLNYTKDKFGDISLVEEEKTTLEDRIEKTNLGCPTKCFKREMIKDVYFPERKRFEDIIFTLEALCKVEKYSYFEDSFFTYRQVQNSNFTSVIDESTILDILEELMKMYRLCIKYPKHKKALMNRIKKDKLTLRLELLDKLIETGENNYRDYF